jgi:hypothetical protein
MDSERGVKRNRGAARSGFVRAVRVATGVLLATTALPVLAAAAVAGTSTPSAPAQVCDDVYGCPTIPTEAGGVPTCSQAGGIVVGGEVRPATVDGVPAGSQVQITLDGNVAGTGNADADGHATVQFTIPSDIGSGEHPVFAVGAGFSVDCGTVTGPAVLGETATTSAVSGNGTANGGSGSGSGSTSVGAGSLARTGVEIALLVAIGVALILVGQRFVAFDRRRRRRRGRRANAVADLGKQPASRP